MSQINVNWAVSLVWLCGTKHTRKKLQNVFLMVLPNCICSNSAHTYTILQYDLLYKYCVSFFLSKPEYTDTLTPFPIHIYYINWYYHSHP